MKFFKKGIEFNNLAKGFNGIYLMINELEAKINSNYHVDSNAYSTELFSIAFLCRKEILDRIEEYKWPMTAPIIVPMMSKGTIILTMAFEYTIGRVYKLAHKFNLMDKVNDVLEKGMAYYELEKAITNNSIRTSQNEYKMPEINQKNRELSINQLSSNIGCPPNLLKEKLFQKFDSVDTTIEACNQVIEEHYETRFEQAKQYNIHPDDTPAAIMIEMTNEYISILKERKRKHDNIFIEMAQLDKGILADLITAQATGDMNKFNKIIQQHPEFLDAFIHKMARNKEMDDED